MGRKLSHAAQFRQEPKVAGPLSDEEDEEVPEPVTDATRRLSEALARATTPQLSGEFSFGGPAPMLPGVPGLTVEGVGIVPVPLTEEMARKLKEQCEQAPFGKGFDTVLDESVRKTWQLSMKPQDRKVSIRNPHFQEGLNKLMNEHVTPRLGFKDGQLRCEPYKLLVYEPGGHFLKHQDTEKEDGMIATLVIQLPSEHQGGDLVVYQGNTMPKEFRHDFGKVDGTAPFAVHYAVHYADAAHSVERVTSGYRLALVYSICLPPAFRHLYQSSSSESDPMVGGIANALQQVAAEGTHFTWILKHEYTSKSVGELGSGALKGEDRARLQALEEANQLSTDPRQRMAFYLANLECSVDYYDVSSNLGDSDYFEWEKNQKKYSVEKWYTLSGQSFGHCYSIDWQKRFQPCESLLNPDKATLAELWGNQGEVSYESYMGNSSATKDTRYNRYAVIAWPLTENIGRARQYIGEDAAIAALAGGPVNFAALQSFMADTIAKASGYWRPSVVFGESMIKMLVDWSGEDYELANLFIEKLFPRFRAEVKLAPPFGSFFSAFGWAKIGVSVTQAIASMPKDSEALKFALALAESTKTGCIDAYRLFLDFSVKVARSIRASELTKDSETLKALWKATIDDADQRSFLEWSTYVQQIDPSMLGAFVDSSKSFMVLGMQSDANTVKTEFSTSTTLLRLARLRLDWINTQRSKGETWEMPMAIYARDRRVEAFLRGPEQTMTLNEFQNAKHATNYSRKHARDQENASFTMKNQARTVIITKTREYFIQQQASGGYDQESRDLSRLCGVEFVDFATAPPPSKRVKRSNTGRTTMPPSGMLNASFPSASSIPPYQDSAALAPPPRIIVSHPIRTLELSQEPPQMGDNAFLSSHPLHSSIQHQPNQLTRPLYPSALARHNYGDPLPSVPQLLINGQPVSASNPLRIRLPPPRTEKSQSPK